MSSLPRSNAPIVELDRVDLEIAGSRVLSGIDWRLERDRHCGIVGPNGSGKSSFLGLIAGSLWPAPGRGARRYTFDGRQHVDAVEARRRIAVVGPEQQDLYTRWGWNFSALDVVLSGLFRTDVPRRGATEGERARAQARLAEVELGELAARPFLRLSRGEQRRVLIARAMAFEPEVLLLDEPAAGLDADARRRLDASIAEAARRATVVATAHAVEQLPSVCGNVLHVEAGRIVGCEAFDSRRHATGGTLALPETPRRRRKPAGRRASAPPALVEIEHADVWRSGRRILKDVCWRLEPDQHWLISGANGAGKSSLLKLVHGQLRPARGGTIAWPGLGNPRNVWALRRRVAYVSPELQAEYLYPTTVHDCIASGIESSIGLTRPLMPAETDRVAELLERFSLTGLAHRRLASLSYGQRRCALIARTLVNAPTILLLDEPTEGLDPPTAREVLALIGDSVAAGTSLVCASHLADVGSVFNCSMRLDAGAIVET